MNPTTQLTGLQKQHDLQIDLVTELLKMDDDVNELGPATRAKLTELKQLSIELQRLPLDEGAETSTLSMDDSFWDDWLRRHYPNQFPFNWFDPGRGANLINATGANIVVRTFDQRDTLRWIPYATYTIAPGTYRTIYARADSYIQADISGRLQRVPVGKWNAWDGTTLRTR